jgi:vancomycin resistance protein YoaR
VAELAARLVPRRRPRLWIVGVGLLVVLAAAPYVRALDFRGEALPGTRVAGVELAGRERAEAIAAIQAAAAPQLGRPVVLSAGERRLAVRPREVFTLNSGATADAALASSRQSEPERIAALVGLREADVQPVLVERPEAVRALIARVRAAGGLKARSAGIEMDGLAPVVHPSRAGRRLDVGAVLASRAPAEHRRRRACGGDRARARRRPRLRAPRPAPAANAAAGRTRTPAPVRRARHGVPRHARPARLARVLDPALGGHKQRAVNARFEFAGDVVRVLPDRAGVGLDGDAAVAAVTAAAYAPDRRVAEVRVGSVPADVTAAELSALGITRRLSAFTTDMGVSSSNRIWNVQLMARYIDGTVIRPGEVFSFNRVVGERTVERGFREGQMIVGSLLLPSIGGGVCQTATTLFNNAFELGLPVQRRYNHSFYISHYPLGRDATVSWGGPDLVFRNDLDRALLIKSSYTSSTLTFTFYGTPQGRRVVAETGPQTNWKQPRTSHAYDPYAPAGSVRTSTGSNQPGFDVTVKRTVYERGNVLRRDAFRSRYIPVGPTLVYGPGANPPRVDFTLPPPE